MKIESEKKELLLPITIEANFSSLEQKLIFEAIVLPDIKDVLLQYAPLLDCDKSN